MPSDTPMVLNCQASMPCFSTDLLTILPMSITGECQSYRNGGSSSTSGGERISSAYSVCWNLMLEPEGMMVISEMRMRRVGWLTCKGFPPTIRSKYQHVERFSWPGRQGLQQRRALPCARWMNQYDMLWAWGVASRTDLSPNIVVSLGHAVTPSVECASGRERVPLDVVAVLGDVPGPVAIADGCVHFFLSFSLSLSSLARSLLTVSQFGITYILNATKWRKPGTKPYTAGQGRRTHRS